MIPRISEAEWRIMQLLWKHAPQTAQELIDALNPNVTWTLNTVKTLLNRLVKKGALTYEKEGRAFLYSPQISEDEMRESERQSFLNRVYSGSLKPMLAAFLNDSNLTDEEIIELKMMLEQKDKQ